MLNITYYLYVIYHLLSIYCTLLSIYILHITYYDSTVASRFLASIGIMLVRLGLWITISCSYPVTSGHPTSVWVNSM